MRRRIALTGVRQKLREFVGNHHLVPARKTQKTTGYRSSSQSISNNILSRAALPLLIATLWLSTRPYLGAVLDAQFYMGQALHALEPAGFADDLYFRFGSQDQFTIFTALYAPVVALLGISVAAMALTVVGNLLWVFALLYLSRALIRDTILRFLSIAAVIAFPNGYIP